MTALPFSRLRRAGGLVFLAGEVALDAHGSVPEGIAAQTELVLERIAATLATEGLALDDVVSATVYLTDAADFPAFNAAYAKRFAAPLPVRTTVCSALMLPGARVEIAVVAGARA